MTKLREKLQSGETAVAITVNFPNPGLVEFLCWCGFDAVVLDHEHGVVSDRDIEDLARICSAAGAASVVRLPLDAAAIERAAAFGVNGLHLPQVRTAHTVSAAAAALYFPPRGGRGIGNFRAGRYGLATSDMTTFMRQENADKTLIVAIEDRAGISELDSILKNDAVDVVLVGTSDLAIDLGHPGETGHREVLAAVDEIAAAVSASQKVLGLPAKSPGEVAKVRARGARYILTSLTGIASRHLHDFLDAAH